MEEINDGTTSGEEAAILLHEGWTCYMDGSKVVRQLPQCICEHANGPPIKQYWNTKLTLWHQRQPTSGLGLSWPCNEGGWPRPKEVGHNICSEGMPMGKTCCGGTSAQLGCALIAKQN